MCYHVSMKIIAVKLKKIRTEMNIKQSEVAKAVGITANAYSNYEQGIREPSLDMIRKLCKFFNITSDYLLDLEE